MSKRNIGLLNAMIRITCGLTYLTLSIGSGRRNQNLILIVIAAMKVAEGILRFCPIVAICDAYKADKKNRSTVL